MRILPDTDLAIATALSPSPTQRPPDGYLSAEILNALPTPIIVIDRSGQIVLANHAWNRQTPADSCNYFEVCGTSFFNRNPEKSLELRNGISQVLRAEVNEFNLEHSCPLPRGGSRWLRMRCSLLPDRDHAVISYSEISEKKNARPYSQRHPAGKFEPGNFEERTTPEVPGLQEQKLEAITRLAGGIAHDFNNILSSIVGYSELALKRAVDADTVDYLQGSLNACNRARDLIHQILTFSRRQKPALMPLDLRIILQEAIPLVRNSLPEHITVQESLDPACAATILGNPTELRRGIQELCANSAQAMQNSRGTLTITLAGVVVDNLLHKQCPQLKINRRHVLVEIRDTGPGIAPEHIGSIFEPYFSTKAQKSGLGLGLALVYGIVKHHHGVVLVESSAADGTTFRLYFPFVDIRESTALVDIGRPRPKPTCHILLVDDEAPILNALQRGLEQKGYAITCSQFAREATTLFRRSPNDYDLVILDLNMPEITGDLLAKYLKEIRRDIPIVLCSNRSDLPLRSIDVGHVDKILTKPLLHAELVAALEEMLGDQIVNCESTRSHEAG